METEYLNYACHHHSPPFFTILNRASFFVRKFTFNLHQKLADTNFFG